MSPGTAEEAFNAGLVALAGRRVLDAANLFRRAIQLGREYPGRKVDPRYLSYYGLSLARSTGANGSAVQACRAAVSHDPTKPDLLLNLGRVYRMAGRQTLALECFERGTRLFPRHRGLRAELSRVDRRSKPVIPLLRRSHLANHWGGMVRSRLKGLIFDSRRRAA